MAKTTHASPCIMMVSELCHELELKVGEVERCQEMIARLSTMTATEKLSYDVTEFIAQYSGIEVVGEEGIISTAGDLLKKALEALLKAIKWIVEKLTVIFKYIFDSQYRATKEVLDIQVRLNVLAANQNVVKKFPELNGDVISKQDLDDVIAKTSAMTNFISDLISHRDISDIELLVNTHSKDAGISYIVKDGYPVIDDLVVKIEPKRNTKFGDAGWSLEGLIATTNLYLGAIKDIMSLKESEKTVKQEIDELTKEANEIARKGNTGNELNTVQKSVSAKCFTVRIMHQAVGIALRRSHNILALVTALYKEAHKLA